MKNEQSISKNKIIAELTRSAHGSLKDYVPVVQEATKNEPEFMAHLISWNQLNGQVRDAKIALPIASLSVAGFPDELAENSMAHLALQGPRELLRAYRFILEMRVAGKMRPIRRLVEAYLREREANFPKWERMAVQHKGTLKEIYSLLHIKPSINVANVILYGRNLDKTKGELPAGSLAYAVAHLKDMSPVEAAGTIMQRKIPFLIAMGALGAKAKDPDLVLALIGSMTPTELVTNTKMLEKLGIKTNPALRGAYEAALAKASTSKANILKTTRAAEEIEDESLREKLRGVQEKQIQKMGGVEGNWLVLGDKSGSMAPAIEIARHVSATLAKMVKANVWLVFFDVAPTAMNVTGMALDAIKEKTKYITANGGTSIGCGLQRALEADDSADGIAIISDAQENTPPMFANVYEKYCEKFGKQIPVYLYRTTNQSNYWGDRDLAASMRQAGHDIQEFDLAKGIDYYSLPNLVATMRTNRYSLVDEIMDTKLLKLSDVFKKVELKAVHA